MKICSISLHHQSSRNLALLSGVAAGALWGFPFLVPELLPNTEASSIAMGRFFVFGIISFIHLVFYLSQTRKLLTRPSIKTAMRLGFWGNSVYYTLVIIGIQLTGINISSLIIGLLPVTIALSNSGWRVSRQQQLPLALIFFGVVSINLQKINGQPLFFYDFSRWTLGLLCLLAALILWTWYASANARYLKAHPDISPQTWASATGVSTLLFSPLLTVGSFWIRGSHWGDFLKLLEIKFLLWVLILGLGSSWLALRLWNHSSRILDATLSGQLLASETFFALTYGFLYSGIWPNLMELVAIGSILLGVLWALRLGSRTPHSPVVDRGPLV